jgi:hypothetical protein
MMGRSLQLRWGERTTEQWSLFYEFSLDRHAGYPEPLKRAPYHPDLWLNLIEPVPAR